MFSGITEKNKWILFFIFMFSLFCGKVSANICNDIADDPETEALYRKLDEKKLTLLTEEYGKSVEDYFHYPDRPANGHNRFPLSAVHTMISGGHKPFSLLTRANHQAYATARGIHYRYVAPEEYADILGGKRRYWLKVFALRDLLQCEHIPEDSWVMWLDDDIVINDFNHDIPMPDQYIRLFSKEYKVLVTDDVGDSKVNTGIILLRKNEITRQFIQNWIFYSSHPVHGYEAQGKTLHEQEVLRNFLADGMFKELNTELRIVKILPSRRDDLNMNFNTFKREGFVKDQGWDENIRTYGDGEKQWRAGDAFIHCGAGKYKIEIIFHTLDELFSNFSKEKWFSQEQIEEKFPHL